MFPSCRNGETNQLITKILTAHPSKDDAPSLTTEIKKKEPLN